VGTNPRKREDDLRPGRSATVISLALSSLALALLVRRVRRRRTEDFDQQVAAAVGTGQRPADLVSRLAQPSSTLVAALAISCLPQLDGRDRAVLMAAPLLAGVAGHVVKCYVPRDRPGKMRFSPQGDQSFPSTHCAHSAALAFAVAHVGRHHGLGRWTTIGAIAATTAVAVSRLRAGAHWPTDVIAGCLLGIASAQAAAQSVHGS
jgi:membrane-associated phospholipid phosphatase